LTTGRCRRLLAFLVRQSAFLARYPSPGQDFSHDVYDGNDVADSSKPHPPVRAKNYHHRSQSEPSHNQEQLQRTPFQEIRYSHPVLRPAWLQVPFAASHPPRKDHRPRFGLLLKPGPFPFLQSAQVDSVNPGGAQLADVRRFLFSSRPEVLASFVPRDVWPLWIVATPPVELATRTKVLQFDGLPSTASAATSSPRLIGAIVAQEVRRVIPGLD
jgi:hypothetical protein